MRKKDKSTAMVEGVAKGGRATMSFLGHYPKIIANSDFRIMTVH